jgi:hypothetical protein
MQSASRGIGVASRCKAALRGDDRGLDTGQRWAWDPTSAPLYLQIGSRESESEGGGDNRGRESVCGDCQPKREGLVQAFQESPFTLLVCSPRPTAIVIACSHQRISLPLLLPTCTHRDAPLLTSLHFTSLHSVGGAAYCRTSRSRSVRLG